MVVWKAILSKELHQQFFYFMHYILLKVNMLCDTKHILYMYIYRLNNVSFVWRLKKKEKDLKKAAKRNVSFQSWCLFFQVRAIAPPNVCACPWCIVWWLKNSAEARLGGIIEQSLLKQISSLHPNQGGCSLVVLKSWQSSEQCFALCSTRNPLKPSILGNLRVTTPLSLFVQAFQSPFGYAFLLLLIGHFDKLKVHLSNGWKRSWPISLLISHNHKSLNLLLSLLRSCIQKWSFDPFLEMYTFRHLPPSDRRVKLHFTPL